MKLQDIPQPKVQYNHQIENKVAIINFGHVLLNYWYFFSKYSKIILQGGYCCKKKLVIK